MTNDFKVVKITMVIIILITLILSIVSNYIDVIWLLYFNLGSLTTALISFVVMEIKHNIK